MPNSVKEQPRASKIAGEHMITVAPNLVNTASRTD